MKASSANAAMSSVAKMRVINKRSNFCVASARVGCLQVASAWANSTVFSVTAHDIEARRLAHVADRYGGHVIGTGEQRGRYREAEDPLYWS
jgi:hypothetical protein